MKVQFCVGKVSAEGFNYFHRCDPVLKDLIYLFIRIFLNDGNLLTSPVIGWLSGLVVGHRISIWSGRVAKASQTTSPDYRSRRLERKKVLNVEHTKNMNGKEEEQKKTKQNIWDIFYKAGQSNHWITRLTRSSSIFILISRREELIWSWY